MKIEEIINVLRHEFPDAKSDLDFRTPFELLIAVTLSAQTTDAMVNVVTKDLFAKYPDALSLSQAKEEDVAQMINKIGLYRNKSRYIINSSKMLVDLYDGVVPQDRRSLMSLPGVGRKTANVVLAVGFGIPAIAVDTHVERVAKRLKLAKPDDSVEAVEQKLMRKIRREHWAEGHHLLLLFGRYISKANVKEDAFVLLNDLKEKHNL